MKKLLTIITGILLGANLSYGLVTVKTNSVSLTLADTCDGTFNDFKFQLAGYNYNVFRFQFDVNLTGVNCVFRITKPIEGKIYLDVPQGDITVSTTNVSFAIAQTNLPPPGNYYGELLSYQSGTTNYYRSLAQGKLPITWSLYLNDTNYFTRTTTNAAIGQIYIHPNWVYPYWGTTNADIALSNYVVLIDGNLQTNINVASNALRNAIGTVQTNLNTASNALNSVDNIHGGQIVVISNQADVARAIADGLNTRSSIWDTVTSKADNSALISVSNKVDGLNSRSSTWDTVTSKADNSALISVSNVVDGLNSRSSTWDTVTSMAANSALIAVSNMANGLNSRSSIWERVTTGDYLTTSNDVDVVEALAAGLNARSSTWDNAVNVANGLNARSSVWDKASTDAVQATNNIVVSSNFFENRLDTVDTATNSINTAVTNHTALIGDLQTSTSALNTAVGLRVLRAGDIMTGPLTNTAGYYGNGAGLTNLPVADLAGWSGYAATQEVFSSYATPIIFTNILVTGSGLSLPVQGNYTYVGEHNTNNYWSSTNGYYIYFSGEGGVPTVSWLIHDAVQDNAGQFGPAYVRQNISPIGDYIVAPDTTGTPTAVFSYVTNIADWKSGADPTDPQKWHIELDGTNVYRAYDTSNVFDKIVYGVGGFNGNGANVTAVNASNATALGGVAATTWANATNSLNTIATNAIRADGSIKYYGNQDFGAKDATNIGVIGGASLQITGGSPTNGAVMMATNGLGQGVWQRKLTKRHRLTTQTTNNASVTISGIGFRPTGATVTAGIIKPTENLISWGSIDGSGSEGCFAIPPAGGIYNQSLCALVYADSGHTWQLDWTAWTDDGATFTQSFTAGTVTNTIMVDFLFYP